MSLNIPIYGTFLLYHKFADMTAIKYSSEDEASPRTKNLLLLELEARGKNVQFFVLQSTKVTFSTVNFFFNLSDRMIFLNKTNLPFTYFLSTFFDFVHIFFMSFSNKEEWSYIHC